MNRIIPALALLAFAALAAFFLLAGRSSMKPATQHTEPVWTIVFTLPKTNGNFLLTNTLPQAR